MNPKEIPMHDDITTQRALDALMDAELLDEEIVTDADIDAELARIGIDAAHLAEDARALTERLQGGELEWQRVARRKIERHQHLLERPARAHSVTSRDALLARIAEARHDARFEEHVRTFFRNRDPELATDDDLVGLLEDLELLRDLVADDED